MSAFGKWRTRLVAASMALAVLAMALCLGPGRHPDVAIASPETGVEWYECFGSLYTDEGHSVVQTPSGGGYIITGRTYSEPTGYDVYLLKTDSDGNYVWDTTFGGAEADGGYSVQQTSDGGYIIVGYTFSSGAGDCDAWLIKTDSGGSMEWGATFGGTEADGGYSVQQASDGGYIIVGYTFSSGAGNCDAWLIKTDSGGTWEWDATIGGTEADLGYSVQETVGGYVIAGQTFSSGAGSSDAWLIRTDSDGDVVWERTFGGELQDEAHSVQRTSDGGYIIVGRTYSIGAGGSDLYLIKTDFEGNEVWHRTFGGTALDWGFSVCQTGDEGFIVAGKTSSYDMTGPDGWVIRTDFAGKKQWDKVIGGSGSDCFRSVKQAGDGGYVLAGATSSYGAGGADVWLLRLSNPPHQPSNVFPTDGDEDQSLAAILESSDFEDPDSDDTHVASQWQVTAVAGDYFNPVFDSGRDAANLTSRAVAADTLDYGTTYYWRVRYQDNHGAWADYSPETCFTTVPLAPNQPANACPSDGATWVPVTATLRSSAFSDAESDDTHAASQWQVTATSGNYATPVFDSGIVTWELVTMTVPAGTLEYGDTYYWRVRHRDNHGEWSDYSVETSFTASPEPEAPVADFEARTTLLYVPYTVRFTEQCTGVITTWRWDFDGDGTVDSWERNPKHTYKVAGQHTVSLTVTGPGGSHTETKAGYITARQFSLGDCAAWLRPPSETGASNVTAGCTILGLCWTTGYICARRAGRRKSN